MLALFAITGTWYMLNDGSVREATEHVQTAAAMTSSSAYVLMYRQRSAIPQAQHALEIVQQELGLVAALPRRTLSGKAAAGGHVAASPALYAFPALADPPALSAGQSVASVSKLSVPAVSTLSAVQESPASASCSPSKDVTTPSDGSVALSADVSEPQQRVPTAAAAPPSQTEIPEISGNVPSPDQTEPPQRIQDDADASDSAVQPAALPAQALRRRRRVES